MVFSNDDRAVIEACHLEKGWEARRILKEFPGRNWNLSSVSYQIKKIKDTGSTSRKQGSGRPRTAVNDDNKALEKIKILRRGNDCVPGGPTWDTQVSAGNFKRSKCESYFGSSDD